MEAPFAAHTRTPAELREQIEAERAGAPFLVWRSGDGAQRILTLGEGRLTIGRDGGCDVALAHDDEVSRLHAELERVGSHWVLADHGLSTNGTFLNGERLHGEKALHDGDTVRVGGTHAAVPRARRAARRQHAAGRGGAAAETLTPTQRAVLVALCRPYKDGSPFATPASNQDDRRPRSCSACRA